jgi:hypothetical protein
LLQKQNQVAMRALKGGSEAHRQMFLFFFQGQISFWPKKVGVPFWPSKISMLPNGLGSFYSFFTITVARVRVCPFFFTQ